METQLKALPQSLSELAQELTTLAENVERINKDTDSPAVIADRMEADGVEEYAAAFYGLTSAWLQKVFPHLDGVMWTDVRSYRCIVVLQLQEGVYPDRQTHRLEYMLPRAWDYVDDEWAGRPVEKS
jgi:hypothetical protein